MSSRSRPQARHITIKHRQLRTIIPELDQYRNIILLNDLQAINKNQNQTTKIRQFNQKYHTSLSSKTDAQTYYNSLKLQLENVKTNFKNKVENLIRQLMTSKGKITGKDRFILSMVFDPDHDSRYSDIIRQILSDIYGKDYKKTILQTLSRQRQSDHGKYILKQMQTHGFSQNISLVQMFSQKFLGIPPVQLQQETQQPHGFLTSFFESTEDRGHKQKMENLYLDLKNWARYDLRLSDRCKDILNYIDMCAKCICSQPGSLTPNDKTYMVDEFKRHADITVSKFDEQIKTRLRNILLLRVNRLCRDKTMTELKKAVQTLQTETSDTHQILDWRQSDRDSIKKISTNIDPLLYIFRPKQVVERRKWFEASMG